MSPLLNPAFITPYFNIHLIRACDQPSKHTICASTLGAWFTFVDPYYTTHRASLFVTTSTSSADPSLPTPIDVNVHIRTALRTHPTVHFLHGNCATRVLHQRVQHYQAFVARLRANVLAPDYRGFGDSTVVPSEVGLTTDVLAAWDWLRTHGASHEDVLVVGNSLGMGAAVQFASTLQELELGRGTDPQSPRGVVLLAPFSSIEALLDNYYIMGPLLAPLRVFPFLFRESLLPSLALSCLCGKMTHMCTRKADMVSPLGFLKRFSAHRFDTLSKITVSRSRQLFRPLRNAE